MELFKGIPYAQPPVGSARWNPPMKLESFDELNKDEFQHQTFCISSQVTDEEPIGEGFETNTNSALGCTLIGIKPIESSIWRRLFGS